MATEKFHVLDDTGLYAFALEIFRLVEDTYVHKTTYDATVTILNERIASLDARVQALEQRELV